jgi:hypothetical protein
MMFTPFFFFSFILVVQHRLSRIDQMR